MPRKTSRRKLRKSRKSRKSKKGKGRRRGSRRFGSKLSDELSKIDRQNITAINSFINQNWVNFDRSDLIKILSYYPFTQTQMINIITNLANKYPDEELENIILGIIPFMTPAPSRRPSESELFDLSPEKPGTAVGASAPAPAPAPASTKKVTFEKT